MRGVFIAEEDDIKSFYIDNIFDAIWRDGLNMNDQNIIDKVLKNLNINPKTFMLRCMTQINKEKLKIILKKLLIKEFLVLQLFVKNKIFWGQDRLEYAINEIIK